MTGTKRASTESPSVPEVILFTGFPDFLACSLMRKQSEGDAKIVILVAAAQQTQAADFLRSLPNPSRARVLVGDVVAMDLGLSGDEYQQLKREVTTVHHVAGTRDPATEYEAAMRLNRDGTRGIIDFCSEAPLLRRLCHWSTANVAGKRKGVVLEEELDVGQSFHNAHEESRFEAEKLAEAAKQRLPVTILRPSVIVGDSQTGVIDRFDGPYGFMVLLAKSAPGFRIPMPGPGTAPLHLVPVDFVVNAGLALAHDLRAAGLTFHLTDPNPLPARRVYEMVADHARGKLSRGHVPTGLARTLLRAPGTRRWGRSKAAFLDLVDSDVYFNSRRTCSLLTEAGVTCPPFDSYVEPLVNYIKSQLTKVGQAGSDSRYSDVDPAN